MTVHAEERAGWIQRAALRLSGFPPRTSIYHLVDWLGDAVRVVHRPRLAKAKIRFQLDFSGLIELPAHFCEVRLTEALLHESAHFLCRHGAAALFYRSLADSEDYRLRRLGRLWSRKEEAEVEEFVTAWYLPSWLVQQYRSDPDLLVELSDCEPALVRARLNALGSWSLPFDAPCAWSAWRHFVLRRWGTAAAPQFRIAPVSGGGDTYIIPTSGRHLAETERQLKADLLSLTPLEFGLKHSAARALPAECAALDLEALLPAVPQRRSLW